MRSLLDKILRGGIKLSLLTGVAFTFAACYGPCPPPNDPDYQADQQKLEQQLLTTSQAKETPCID